MKNLIRNAVMRLHWQGYYPRNIALMLGVNEDKVKRILEEEL